MVNLLYPTVGKQLLVETIEDTSSRLDESDRIFIDAKLAISSPVTILELCITLEASRFKVYPSRSFPSSKPIRDSLFRPYIYWIILSHRNGNVTYVSRTIADKNSPSVGGALANLSTLSLPS